MSAFPSIFLLLACGLALLAMLARVFPHRLHLWPLGMAALSCAGFAFAIAALATGTASIPPRTPAAGCGAWLALDGLSAVFLLPAFAAGIAAGAAASDSPHSRPLLPLLQAAVVFTLLAADVFVLVAGLSVVAVLLWALLPNPRRGVLGPMLLGAGLLIPAWALAAPAACAGALVPTGSSGAIPFLLVFAATLLLAGIVPAGAGPIRAQASCPGPEGAILAGAIVPLALYVFARFGLALMGHAPLWWCVPLLAAGLIAAVAGAARAVASADMPAVLAGLGLAHTGFALIGFGLAFAARASDLPPLEALAFSGALLLILAHGVAVPLLALCAGAVEQGAGSRLLSSLGGLAIGMPRATVLAAAGAFAAAGLPPGPFFAARWLLIQSLIATTRIGSFGFRMALAATAILIALAAALALAAMVRLMGVAFLGRPRTPRGAAAEEAGWGSLMGMAWLAALGVLLGLFPGAALELAAPAIRQIAGAEMGPPTGAMALSSVVMQPGLYTALLIAVLLGALTLGAWAFARGPERTKARSVPPWNDGFAAPPPWLPFGDPATQLGPDSFARLVAYALPAWPGLPLLARIGPWLAQALAVTDRAARRRGQTALLATLALLLAAIAWRGS